VSRLRTKSAGEVPAFGDQIPLVLLPDAWIPVGQAAQFWFTIAVVAVALGSGVAFHWVRNWGV